MTALDTARAVLAKASLYDQTFANPDIGIAVAWADLIGDVDRDDALTAVRDHYASQARRIMPVDVTAGVRKARGARIERAVEDVPEADADPDDVALYLALIRRERRRIADGEPAAPRVVHPARDVRSLIGATAAQMPSMPGNAEVVRKAFDEALRAKKVTTDEAPEVVA